jgi:acetyl-CoA synthetase
MTSALEPNERVHQLITQYGTPDACVAALLCDERPANAVAYTVVEPDLSATTLTYGRLGELSQRFAAGGSREA